MMTVELAQKEFNEMRAKLLGKYADAENLRKTRQVSLASAEKMHVERFAHKLAEVAEEVVKLGETSDKEEGVLLTVNAMKHSLAKHGLEKNLETGKWTFK
jgi:molecular chaperone GrpE (heat shock protein)